MDDGAAPVDSEFDLSHRRVSVTEMLKRGENRFAVDLTEPKPLKFLPALLLWGDFAVDGEGRLVKQPKTIRPGDWREQGYPALRGTGRYRGFVDFDSRRPTHLVVEVVGTLGHLFVPSESPSVGLLQVATIVPPTGR